MRDFTDHVWGEVCIPSLQRYGHVDPCERAFDAPLMVFLSHTYVDTHIHAYIRVYSSHSFNLHYFFDFFNDLV